MKVFSKKQPVDVFPVVVAKIEKGRQLLDLPEFLSYFSHLVIFFRYFVVAFFPTNLSSLSGSWVNSKRLLKFLPHCQKFYIHGTLVHIHEIIIHHPYKQLVNFCVQLDMT